MSKKIVAFFVLLSAFSFIGTSQVKKIAILPIRDVNNEIQTGPKLFIRSSISSAITETPGYEAYDRINLSAIINEQDFQRNGLVSDGEIHKIGEMAGADYVLDAVVAPFDDISVTVDAKITNVETARIENEAVEIISIKDIDKIKIGCTELSKKLLKVIAPSMSVCNHSEKSSSNVVALADRSIIEKTDDGIALDGFVDLGLSVKWAACNLGALSPEQPGGYYAWGETSIKSVYSKKTYEYHGNPSQLPLDKDAANIKLSGKCRIPTRKEWTELITL